MLGRSMAVYCLSEMQASPMIRRRHDRKGREAILQKPTVPYLSGLVPLLVLVVLSLIPPGGQVHGAQDIRQAIAALTETRVCTGNDGSRNINMNNGNSRSGSQTTRALHQRMIRGIRRGEPA